MATDPYVLAAQQRMQKQRGQYLLDPDNPFGLIPEDAYQQAASSKAVQYYQPSHQYYQPSQGGTDWRGQALPEIADYTKEGYQKAAIKLNPLYQPSGSQALTEQPSDQAPSGSQTPVAPVRDILTPVAETRAVGGGSVGGNAGSQQQQQNLTYDQMISGLGGFSKRTQKNYLPFIKTDSQKEALNKVAENIYKLDGYQPSEKAKMLENAAFALASISNLQRGATSQVNAAVRDKNFFDEKSIMKNDTGAIVRQVTNFAKSKVK